MKKIEKLLNTGRIKHEKEQLKESKVIAIYMQKKQCSQEAAERWYREYRKNLKTTTKQEKKNKKLIGNTEPFKQDENDNWYINPANPVNPLW